MVFPYGPLWWPGLAWPIQDPGSRILDPGSWILYPASWIPDPWKSYTIPFRNTTSFCDLGARERENACNVIVYYHILFYIILYRRLGGESDREILMVPACASWGWGSGVGLVLRGSGSPRACPWGWCLTSLRNESKSCSANS
jgi:hypothetical protein